MNVSENTDPAEQTDTESTADKPDDRQPLPDQPSGVMRLWRPADDAVNPLLIQSRASRAVYDLVFEGLFQIDAAQDLQPRLIDQISYSQDQLQVELTLNRSRMFHNGRPVRAADLARTIQFILEHAESSPYAGSLAMVSAVSVEDDWTVRLLLDQSDPWFAYALTFPVLPEAYLDGEDPALLSGTGRFRIINWTENQVLQLENTQEPAALTELKRIDVRPYKDISAAMQAFSSDQIDLIYLPADVYQAYRPRTNLRFDAYSGNRFIFLAFQTASNRVFADSNAFFTVKQILQQSFHNQDYHEHGEITSVPLAMSSGVLDAHRPDVLPVLDQLIQQGQTWRPSEQPLELIWPDNDPVRQDLAQEIGVILLDHDIQWQGQALSQEQFVGQLQAGSYDLALLGAALPDRPDPGWLYLSDDHQLADGDLTFSLTGAADYVQWQDLLKQVWLQPPGDSFAGEDLAVLLAHAAAQSPWYGLIIQSEALLYGDRVIGQSSPNQYNPYEGIEALWVWSTQ